MTTDQIVHSYLKMFGLEYWPDNFLSADEKNYIVDCLTGKEEKSNSSRDEWGNWDAKFSKYNYAVPYLDQLISKKIKQHQLAKTAVWPGERKFAFCLTHDLDVISANDYRQLHRRYQKYFDSEPTLSGKFRHAPYLLYTLLKSLLKPVHNDKLWQFEKWTDLERTFGFRSTYYIYAADKNLHKFDCDYRFNDAIVYRGVKMKVSDYIVKVAEEGNEIGLHGSYNTFNDADLFISQLDNLKKITGSEITTTRQHFLHYDIYKTPAVHRKAGVKTDSTLGFNCASGFRAGTSMPYFLAEGILEVPMHIMDGALFNENSHNFNETQAKTKVVEIIDSVEEVGGCLVINFHPNYLDRTAWWNTYVFLLEELHSRNAWCGSMEGIYKIALDKCAE
ncbi:MAG: hypothetical protein ABI772_10085 [Bacteroidota bacterium]